MNNVEMSGRLAAEPRLAPTDAGRPVCDMRLSADNGRYRPFDIAVSVFDAAAEVCAGRLSKGDEVRVTGELRFRRWRDRGGRWHEGFSIAGRVERLGVDRDKAEAGPGDGPEVGRAATISEAPAAASGPQLGVVAGRQGRYGDPYA